MSFSSSRTATAVAILAFITVIHSVFAAGGNLAPCRTDQHCNNPRKCRSISESTALALCSSSDSLCICIPPDISSQIACEDTSTCSANETCVQPPSGLVQNNPLVPPKVCVDDILLSTNNQLAVCQTNDDCPASSSCINSLVVRICITDAAFAFPVFVSSPSPVPILSMEGFMGIPINPSSDPSVAEESLEPSVEPSPDFGDRNLLTAPSSSESAISGVISDPSSSGTSINDIGNESPASEASDSDDATASPEQNGDSESSATGTPQASVCIAAKSLSHLPSHMLIYKNHIPAYVLCDENESCATAGHMVRYQNEVMMMKTYCEQVACDRKVMHVNSPRYQRQLQVRTDTPHLTFLAFAARHNTQAEEHFLRAIVRLGL